MKYPRAILIAAAIVFLLMLAENNSAAGFTVTNTSDSGPGSLRQALLSANTNNQDDMIAFDKGVFSSPQTITLASELIIQADNFSGSAKNLTITGPGANLLTITGNNHSRVLFIDENSKIITISGIRFTGGNGVGALDNSHGGGIRIHNSSTVNLNAVVVTGNSANGNAGGIQTANGILNITDSTISNNNTTNQAGGGVFGFESVIAITRSAFSSNVGGGDGGAIFLTGGSLTS